MSGCPPKQSDNFNHSTKDVFITVRYLISGGGVTPRYSIVNKRWLGDKSDTIKPLCVLTLQNSVVSCAFPENYYSRTFRKRSPKMSSLGGRLWKVVAYESSDYNGSKRVLISIW